MKLMNISIFVESWKLNNVVYKWLGSGRHKGATKIKRMKWKPCNVIISSDDIVVMMVDGGGGGDGEQCQGCFVGPDITIVLYTTDCDLS